METLAFTEDHSAKNIPIPGRIEYLKHLVFAIEKLINRMRLAKIHFDRKHSTDPKVRNNLQITLMHKTNSMGRKLMALNPIKLLILIQI